MCCKKILWGPNEIQRKVLWYFNGISNKILFCSTQWAGLVQQIRINVSFLTPPMRPQFIMIFYYLWNIFLQSYVCACMILVSSTLLALSFSSCFPLGSLCALTYTDQWMIVPPLQSQTFWTEHVPQMCSLLQYLPVSIPRFWEVLMQNG